MLYEVITVKWMRHGNLLEILTVSPKEPARPAAGTLKIKIGFYLKSEGFVVGRNTRLFLLNVVV